jgi:AsmA protein
MNVLKKTIIGIFSLFLVLSLILLALAKTIKPDLVKDYVASELTELTQQPSKITGNISWQIFPRPAIKITGVQIGEQNGKAHYCVKLDNLHLNLKITPLLRGKLVFSEVDVNGFQINLNPLAQQYPFPEKKKTQPRSDKGLNIAEQFAIERILLSHGQIRLEKGQTSVIANLQIGAEEFNLNKIAFPTRLKAQLNIRSGEQTLLKTQISFKGSLALSSTILNSPLLALKNSSLTGQLAMQNLEVSQLKINKIAANVKTQTGMLIFNPLTLSLYGGESMGDLSYELASMKVTLNQMATNLNGSKLLFDLLHTPLLKGNMDFSLHAQANLQNTWPDNILGNGSLTLKDGEIESVNLDHVIDETSNKISQLLKDKTDEPSKDALQLSQSENLSFPTQKTIFKLLTLQYSIHDAKLHSDSLILHTERLQLKGGGSLSLKDHVLNSHLLARVSATNPEVDKIQQILGGNFPLVVQGYLTQPTILPDLNIINPILAKYWLKTLIKPVKEIQQQIKAILTHNEI